MVPVHATSETVSMRGCLENRVRQGEYVQPDVLSVISSRGLHHRVDSWGIFHAGLFSLPRARGIKKAGDHFRQQEVEKWERWHTCHLETPRGRPYAWGGEWRQAGLWASRRQRTHEDQLKKGIF